MDTKENQMGTSDNGLNPHVEGICTACGKRSLFLGKAGYVTCSIAQCPDPSAIADLLSRAIARPTREARK